MTPAKAASPSSGEHGRKVTIFKVYEPSTAGTKEEVERLQQAYISKLSVLEDITSIDALVAPTFIFLRDEKEKQSIRGRVSIAGKLFSGQSTLAGLDDRLFKIYLNHICFLGIRCIEISK